MGPPFTGSLSFRKKKHLRKQNPINFPMKIQTTLDYFSLSFTFHSFCQNILTPREATQNIQIDDPLPRGPSLCAHLFGFESQPRLCRSPRKPDPIYWSTRILCDLCSNKNCACRREKRVAVCFIGFRQNIVAKGTRSVDTTRRSARRHYPTDLDQPIALPVRLHLWLTLRFCSVCKNINLQRREVNFSGAPFSRGYFEAPSAEISKNYFRVSFSGRKKLE